MLIAKFASPAQHAQQGHKQLKTDLPLILAKLVNLLYSIIWRFHSKHMNKKGEYAKSVLFVIYKWSIYRLTNIMANLQ